MEINEILKDTWAAFGKDADSLKETLTVLSDCTKTQEFYGEEVTIYSLCRSEKAMSLNSNSYYMYCYNRETLDDVFDLKKQSVVTVKKDKFEGYEEEFRKSGILLELEVSKNKKELFMFSKDGLMSMATKAGCCCERFFERNNYVRDMWLADALTSMKFNVGHNSLRLKLIYRTDGERNKIYSVLGCGYSFIPQDVMCDMLLRIGKESGLTVKYWKVCHDRTEIRMLAEDLKANGCVPGLRIVTSDIGKSSYVIQYIIQKDDGGDADMITPDTEFAILDESTLLHNYAVTEEVFEDEVRKIVDMIKEPEKTEFDDFNSVIKSCLPKKHYDRFELKTDKEKEEMEKPASRLEILESIHMVAREADMDKLRRRIYN